MDCGVDGSDIMMSNGEPQRRRTVIVPDGIELDHASGRTEVSMTAQPFALGLAIAFTQQQPPPDSKWQDPRMMMMKTTRT